MTAEAVCYLLSNQEPKVRLKFQIALQCAPLLKRVKIACITNIDQRLCKELSGTLKGAGISFKVLGVKEGKVRILFYRKEEFGAYIARSENLEFLRSYGYSKGDVNSILLRLSERMQQALDAEDEFPHEIGVFLGYPIEDVRGFVIHKGKHYLIAGYWKVYGNPMKAAMIFHSYDHARTSVVNEVLIGKSIDEIVCYN